MYRRDIIFKIASKLSRFHDKMLEKMRENIEEKGDSWESCSAQWLQKKLQEHVEAKDWVAVANYAFMLDDITKEPRIQERRDVR